MGRASERHRLTARRIGRENMLCENECNGSCLRSCNKNREMRWYEYEEKRSHGFTEVGPYLIRHAKTPLLVQDRNLPNKLGS